MTKYRCSNSLKETITPKELKKVMKLSIAIDMALGFYIAYHQHTIAIDRCDNWNPDKTKIYSFAANELHDIVNLVNAYAKVYKRHILPR